MNAPLPKHVSTKDLCDLSPAYIRAIAPYQPGKPTSELAREMGIDEKSIVKLASNENPRGIGPRTRAAIEAALGDLARYPDGNGFELKDALSRRYGAGMDSIVLGNGSNDVLELVAMAFLGAGSSAVYSQHSFAVYPLATQARGARGISVPAKDYGHDLDAMARAVTGDTRVVFIANPNNPTGTFVPYDDIARFARRYRQVAQAPPEPCHHPHFLQGLRPGRAARGLRDGASGGGRPHEPRAPAIQCQ